MNDFEEQLRKLAIAYSEDMNEYYALRQAIGNYVASLHAQIEELKNKPDPCLSCGLYISHMPRGEGVECELTVSPAPAVVRREEDR